MKNKNITIRIKLVVYGDDSTIGKLFINDLYICDMLVANYRKLSNDCTK